MLTCSLNASAILLRTMPSSWGGEHAQQGRGESHATHWKGRGSGRRRPRKPRSADALACADLGHSLGTVDASVHHVARILHGVMVWELVQLHTACTARPERQGPRRPHRETTDRGAPLFMGFGSFASSRWEYSRNTALNSCRRGTHSRVGRTPRGSGARRPTHLVQQEKGLSLGQREAPGRGVLHAQEQVQGGRQHGQCAVPVHPLLVHDAVQHLEHFAAMQRGGPSQRRHRAATQRERERERGGEIASHRFSRAT